MIVVYLFVPVITTAVLPLQPTPGYFFFFFFFFFRWFTGRSFYEHSCSVTDGSTGTTEAGTLPPHRQPGPTMLYKWRGGGGRDDLIWAMLGWWQQTCHCHTLPTCASAASCHSSWAAGTDLHTVLHVWKKERKKHVPCIHASPLCACILDFC